MDKQPDVKWIQVEFFSGYPFGHYRILFKPEATIEYTGEGELSVPLYGSYKWKASPRIYKNLAKILIDRRWENETNPAGEGFEVCDGWTDTVSWSFNGEIHEYSVQIGVGPESILKIIDRMHKLLKDEGRKILYSN
ncbi:hypothetical protein [Paenibacillus terrigena]|uniref:hypothetical protein n=1 Tax=Paenibacillus terrigena TaxID=369333 RepID=UPI00036CA5A4|nr:hypothetical protein [Paenibacillus terrigena]